MKKFTFLALVAAFAMVAAPALADHTLGGYFRTQFVKQDALTKVNIGGADYTLPSKDAKENNIIDQRLRMKYTNTLSDDMKIVYYGEVDTPWGQNGKAAEYGGKSAISGGGTVGADGVNLETKNAYAQFTLGNGTATVGIQGFGGTFDSFVVNQDMAGVKYVTDLSGAKATLFYSMWNENKAGVKDDTDFFAAEYQRDAFTVAFYDFADQDGEGAGERTDEYVIGAKYNYGMGDVWFALNSGTASGGADVSAYAFNATYKQEGLGNFRFVYVSAADEAGDDGTFNSNTGAFNFYMDGLQIFFYDVYYNNAQGGGLANQFVNSGNGLMAFTYNNKADLGDDVYLKYAAGYFMVADDEPEAGAALEGTDLGLEVSAMVGKKFGAADLSIRGAYAALGSAFDGTAGGQDPDDVSTLVAMVNIGF